MLLSKSHFGFVSNNFSVTLPKNSATFSLQLNSLLHILLVFSEAEVSMEPLVHLDYRAFFEELHVAISLQYFQILQILKHYFPDNF